MAVETTLTTGKAWHPDVQGFVPGDVIPDALILTTSTKAGEIEGDEPSVRVPFVEDGDATIVPEGTVIPDLDAEFDEVAISTHKISTLGKFSYESMSQPNAARLILDSMQRSVINKADAVYLGNASAPTGLLNVANIVQGGTLGTNLDSLIDAQSAIEAAGGTATDLIASPSFWAAALKLKSGTDFESNLLGAGTQATERFLLGVPVRVSARVPAGSALLLDRGAVVSAHGAVRLARSEDAFFSSDVVAVRVTWRIGFGVLRPGRVAKLTLA